MVFFNISIGTKVVNELYTCRKSFLVRKLPNINAVTIYLWVPLSPISIEQTKVKSHKISDKFVNTNALITMNKRVLACFQFEGPQKASLRGR